MAKIKGFNDKEQRLYELFQNGSTHSIRELKKKFMSMAKQHCETIYNKGSYEDYHIDQHAQSFVRNSLRKLVRDEWIEKVDHGTYALTAKGKRWIAQGKKSTASFGAKKKKSEEKAKKETKKDSPEKAKKETKKKKTSKKAKKSTTKKAPVEKKASTKKTSKKAKKTSAKKETKKAAAPKEKKASKKAKEIGKEKAKEIRVEVARQAAVEKARQETQNAQHQESAA